MKHEYTDVELDRHDDLIRYETRRADELYRRERSDAITEKIVGWCAAIFVVACVIAGLSHIWR